LDFASREAEKRTFDATGARLEVDSMLIHEAGLGGKT
jgi:hypothetical protein